MLRPAFRRRHLAAAALALLLPGPVPAQDRVPPSILLISVDTLRRDHLSLYGYDRPTDAALRAHEKSFRVFENAFTTLPLTLPAHLSLMTGRYPLELGVFNNRQSVPVDENRPLLLAEILRARGYRTAAVVASAVLSTATGLDIGFDEYRQPLDRRPARYGAADVNARALELLDPTDRPLFLFVHYYDPHDPFVYPRRYRETLRSDGSLQRTLRRRGLEDVPFSEVLNLERTDRPRRQTLLDMTAQYDGGVRYATDHVAELIEAWDTTPHGRSGIVVVTSDHGEGLGQHGFWSHGMNVYDEQARIPLMVRFPGLQPGREEAHVSLLDLFPTILDAAGEPVESSGRSLLAPPERPGRPVVVQRMRYFLPERPDGVRNWREGDGFAVVSPRFKLIEDDAGSELYDRRKDPLEMQNIAGKGHPEEHRLRTILARWKKQHETDVPWPPELRKLHRERIERLRSLGYTGQ